MRRDVAPMGEKVMGQWSRPTENVSLTKSDSSFDVELDERDDTPRAPVYVDVVARDHERRPIVPAQWRGTDNIKATLKYEATRAGYIAGYHGLRLLPIYTPLALFWSVVGLFKLIGRQLRWMWIPEAFTLEQQAASRGDKDASNDWNKVHREAKSTRKARAIQLVVELVFVIVAVQYLMRYAPWWATAAVLAVAIPVLAHIGRPSDRPIIGSAIVTPRFRKLNSDIVLRAYYAAGLGNPDKPEQQIQFGGPMSRDAGGQGSHVVVDLPYGKGLDDALKAKAAIASGLDVSLSQVFITRDPTSHRRHRLWVADRDPLALPAGSTPLLDCKARDIWEPAPFGLNERGDLVGLLLMWTSVLVGALPRQGKTFSARQLALFAALDPHVRLLVFDGKGSPDWRKFALVAYRYAFGLIRTKAGDPIEILLNTLRGLKADIQDRNDRLSEMPADLCPEGKLTREIARNPRFNMPVTILILDEFHEFFGLASEVSKEIAALLQFVVKVGPSVGIIVVSATQKPSGIGGTGLLSTMFRDFRDAHGTRFALRTGTSDVSNSILGDGVSGEGYDSSKLLPSYKGVGILYGASDETPTVRTFLADQADAEKILIAARHLREKRGTLEGMAAGEEALQDASDVLADVLRVFSDTGRTGLQWQQLAELMRGTMPELYGDITADAISALVRGKGVPTTDVKVNGVGLKGCKRTAIEAAISRRELESGSR
jgi:DNA segregation ATPase FtsK/SpoIIIE, S-DNA-T family